MLREAMCQPRRPDHTATSSATAIWRGAGQPADSADGTETEGPYRVDPAGIAAALLDEPGSRHDGRQGERRAQQHRDEDECAHGCTAARAEGAAWAAFCASVRAMKASTSRTTGARK